MHNLIKKITDTNHHDSVVTLAYNDRIKSRLRITLHSGEDAGVHLPRGSTLQQGDVLQSTEGFTVLVEAAKEKVSTVKTDDPHLLARACYHLGNRHVPLQIEKSWVRYLHDHVLDDMVRLLGLEVTVEQSTFEPEPGAYHTGHSHGHSH